MVSRSHLVMLPAVLVAPETSQVPGMMNSSCHTRGSMTRRSQSRNM